MFEFFYYKTSNYSEVAYKIKDLNKQSKHCSSTLVINFEQTSLGH